MSISKKNKRMNNKIEKNKTQYILDRQTGNIFALCSRNVSKYNFLTGTYVLPERYLLEKAAALNIFQYSLLDKELKKQTSVAEK